MRNLHRARIRRLADRMVAFERSRAATRPEGIGGGDRVGARSAAWARGAERRVRPRVAPGATGAARRGEVFSDPGLPPRAIYAQFSASSRATTNGRVAMFPSAVIRWRRVAVRRTARGLLAPVLPKLRRLENSAVGGAPGAAISVPHRPVAACGGYPPSPMPLPQRMTYGQAMLLLAGAPLFRPGGMRLARDRKN